MILTEAIDTYVQRKRSSGLVFHKGEVELFAFCKHVGNIPLCRVSTPSVLSFLDDRLVSAATWRHKYRFLKRFVEFWSQRGAMPSLVLPPPRTLTGKIFTPYIYTRAEIRSL
jgi:integrase/recombinase XerD